ncbi:MAG: ABC transporter ATP-binding protein [Alphaproteobacteria bacterium]|nr:ABC transporter ATP-binding protein [Alphaproteobacteria bacterium]
MDAGEVVALLGANGAGKSSLIEAVAGHLPIVAGTLRLDGRDVTAGSLQARARAGIAWCPEGRRLFPGLTVEETLDVAATGNRRVRAEAIERMFALFPALAAHRKTPAWQLSGGQQQMLAIARAVIAAPRVVLLDEPSLGLAPAVLDSVFDAVRRLAEDGAAVLLAEQNVARALAVAGRTLVLARGRVILEGPSERIAVDPTLPGALLGV